MVTVEPLGEVDNPINVRMVTRGGVDAAQGPLQAKIPQYVQQTDENIRKTTPFPNFDVRKQK